MLRPKIISHVRFFRRAYHDALRVHFRFLNRVFTRLAQLEAKMGASGGPDFLKTHPASKRRVEVCALAAPSLHLGIHDISVSQRLKELLPQAFQIQAASPDCARIRDNLSAFQDTFTDVLGERSQQPVVVWRYA